VIPSGFGVRCPCPTSGGRMTIGVAGALGCHDRIMPVPRSVVGVAFRVLAGGARGVKRACWVPGVVVLGRLVIATRV